MGAAGATLLLAGVLALTGPAGAQDGFVKGEAAAQADGWGLNMRLGNTAVGFTYGRSLATYRNNTASAQGVALDLGALPTLFGEVQCDGSPPIINLATLPPKSIANSDIAGSDQSRRHEVHMVALGQNPHGQLVGIQDATATAQPASHAFTESENVNIPLVQLMGSKTESQSRIENGTRIAHAVTTGTQLSLLGGLLTLDNPRWEATAKSGTENSNVGTFTFTGGTFNLGSLSVPRTTDQAIASFGNVAEFARNALGFLGVTIEYPKVTLRDNGVEVSPVKFLIENAPLGSNFLSPLWQNPLVAGAREDLIAQDCTSATTQGLLDLIIGALSGKGAVEITAGGVKATTDATNFDVEPFPEYVPPPTDTLPTETVPPFEDTSVPDGSLPFDDSSFDDLADLGTTDFTAYDELPVDTIPTDPAPKRSGTEAALPSANISRLEDGSAGRAAVLVGTLALLGALALSFGDRLMGRRTRRRIP